MPLPSRIASALAGGETVIASSARAARALRRLHGEAQRAQGLAAWKSADILDWDSWLGRLWQKHLRSGSESRLLLSSAQEQQVWAQVVKPEIEGKRLISVQAVSALAQQAYALLYEYGARDFIAAEVAANQDVEDFRIWARRFEQRCNQEEWISGSRLPLVLHDAVLRSKPAAAERLLLTGYDRTTPAQDYLLEAFKQRGHMVEWAEATEMPAVAAPVLVSAVDRRDEIYTCALWVQKELSAGGNEQRIAVVVPGVSNLRPEIERIFREVLAPHAVAIADREVALPFEFSLGVPLADTPMARAALLFLRWLHQGLSQDEASWLLLSGFLCADAEELLLVARFDARLRQNSMRQPEQEMDTLLQFLGKQWDQSVPLKALYGRLVHARRLHAKQQRLNFDEWTKVAEEILQVVLWPGAHVLQSEDYQVQARWAKLLDTMATLAFDGRKIDYAAFVDVLELQARQTIFAPESRDAPVQILGPLEAAGLTFDALWFLSADDASWPAPARPHPFLSRSLQRKHAMPHASSELDWKLAQQVMLRLVRSSARCVFSYAAQNGDVACRPSTVLAAYHLSPGEVINYASAQGTRETLDSQEQAAIVPWPIEKDAGGSEVLKDQAACAFRSFAKRRLAARAVDDSDWGLDAGERGSLVHKILETLWKDLKDRAGLLQAADGGNLPGLVAHHVDDALQRYSIDGPKHAWNQAYLDAERKRITTLIEAWLAYEQDREEFVVEVCEQKYPATVGELKLQLRVDRVDLLENGRVIIDYKTGPTRTEVWDGPRPDEPQLPIYATYGQVEALHGVLLGKVAEGNIKFIGRVEKGSAISADVKDLTTPPYSADMQQQWQGVLLNLAQQFVRGEAQVDPKDYPATCKFCDLPGLCRIAETERVTDDDANNADGESGA